MGEHSDQPLSLVTVFLRQLRRRPIEHALKLIVAIGSTLTIDQRADERRTPARATRLPGEPLIQILRHAYGDLPLVRT